ncbi:hypothetical protein K0A97_02460 [Patescibacteria group bacterium]|nr:hypothetical protein [Patescibacteria group bacterium]
MLKELKGELFKIKSKRGIISDYLPWVLIAVAVLVILILAIALLRGKGVSLVDKLWDILRP